MPITQNMIDIVNHWNSLDYDQRFTMLPVIHDAFIEGGYSNIAYRHFKLGTKRLNATYNQCCMKDSCDIITLVKYKLEKDLDSIEAGKKNGSHV